MTMETEPGVAEKPATHKKKAQMWVIAIVGLVFILLGVDAVRRVNQGPPKRETTVERVQAPAAAPQKSRDEFEQQLKSQERRRSGINAAAEKETPEQTLARLRQVRDARADDPQAELETMGRDGTRVRNGRATDKSPEELWAEKETTRVLDSRRAPMKVKLVSGTADSTAAGSAVPRAGVTARGREPLDSAQGSVRSEIERIQQLRAGIERNEIGPEELTARLAGGDTRDRQQDPVTRLASTGTGFGQRGVSPQSIADRGPGSIVGRPASEEKPQAGQKLISTGTVARWVLDQKVISDYDGPVRGMLIDDVYDITNKFIMIPKGTRVVGRTTRVSNVNEPIQARMGILISSLVLPDGAKIDLKKSPSLDAEGVAAIKDKVNYHFLAQFLGVAAYAVVASETSRSGSGIENDTTVAGEIGESLREQFAPLAAKYLNLVPTITLRPGTPMRIFFEDDVYALPWTSLGEELIRPDTSQDERT